jgi:hypothetical protein
MTAAIWSRSARRIPDLWAIIGNRLFLFYGLCAAPDFLAQSVRFIVAAADRKWPAVARRSRRDPR